MAAPEKTNRDFFVEDAYALWKGKTDAQIQALPKNRNGLLDQIATELMPTFTPATEKPNYLISKKWTRETNTAVIFSLVAGAFIIGGTFVTVCFFSSTVANFTHLDKLHGTYLGLGLAAGLVGGSTLVLMPIDAYLWVRAARKRGEINNFDRFLNNQPVSVNTFKYFLLKGIHPSVLPPLDVPAVDDAEKEVAKHVSMNQILPGIYLGNKYGAGEITLIDPVEMRQDRIEDLQKQNVGYIVKCTGTLPEDQKVPGITYKCFDIKAEGDNIQPHFEELYQFIEQAKAAGRNVFIHCNEGTSRSASLVIAYLMKKHGLSYQQALNLVKAQRPCAEPIANFAEQLQQYEIALRAPPVS